MIILITKLTFLMKRKQKYNGGLTILIMHAATWSLLIPIFRWKSRRREIYEHYPPTERLCHNSEIDHINVVELQAIKGGVWTYCFNKHYAHIRVICDNMTITSYISNMGCIKSDSCNKIVCNLWDFFITEKLWILAAHIPKVFNEKSDKQSRIFDNTAEWQLNLELFRMSVKNFKS